MVSASDLRPGVLFRHENTIYETVQYQHVQRPRLAPLVRAKIRDVKKGTVVERTFSPDDKFESIQFEEKELQYSYKAGDTYNFMDNKTFEQYEFSESQLGGQAHFLKEECNISVLMHEGDIIGLKLPTKVDLKVTTTAPGVKGNTAGNATKAAELETGITIQVPLFVNEGDTIKVDTRTSEYVERVR
jgi:elongation factor P